MNRSRLLSTPRSFLFTSGENRPLYGIRLGFQHISGSDATALCQGPSHCCLDVTDLSTRQISFTFTNREPGTCCITEIYFNDGNLLSMAVQIVMTDDAPQGSPQGQQPPSDRCESARLPYHDSTTVQAVRGCPEGVTPAPVPDGICRNESLGIVFDLQPGITFSDIINALSRGKLNIGIKLEDVETTGSSLLINTPQLALSPG